MVALTPALPPAAPCSVSVTTQPPGGALYAACAASGTPSDEPVGRIVRTGGVGSGEGVPVFVGVTDGVPVAEAPVDGVPVEDGVTDEVTVGVGDGGTHAVMTAEPAAPNVVLPPAGVFVPPYVAAEVLTKEPPPPPAAAKVVGTPPPPPLLKPPPPPPPFL